MNGIKLDTTVLDRIAENLGRNTDKVLGSIAFQVQGEAQTRAPVDTGALKNSLHTERKKANLYWVADGVEYGIFQELGTSVMAAQPFMVPAVEAMRRQIYSQWRELF